ncbi:type II secretion system F family protein [Psychromicrobium lacuslunae]|uniref:type II secretion system F family protein n=1 Tax=Psychromicrobium lacuslunae TaxID=1618207 RepID=UPI0006983F55|nr:type II secretion system F family protein [Psychromicrobium lacuslunae]
MTIFLLSATACVLLSGAQRIRANRHARCSAVSQRQLRPTAVSGIELLEVFRKLALLLRAGRTDFEVWHQAALGVKSEALKRLLHKAAALAALGISPAAALEPKNWPAQAEPLALQGATELARCLRVSERSGTPLAGLLENLAGHLEQQIDIASLRVTALAGPKATAKLLAWLPLLGFGCGYLMGVDPLAALLSPPWGTSALCAGIILSLSCRVWVSGLIRRASQVA